jgi:hypothetical protein
MRYTAYTFFHIGTSIQQTKMYFYIYCFTSIILIYIKNVNLTSNRLYKNINGCLKSKVQI